MSYDDLMELADRCLKQSGATGNPVVAAELRRLANEYQARAAALDGRLPDIAAAHEAAAQASQVLQQQQPQPQGPGSSDDKNSSD
jgi:hypothetical protein